MTIMKVGDIGYFRFPSLFVDSYFGGFYFKVLGNSVNPDLHDCVYVKTNIEVEEEDDELDARFYGVFDKKGTAVFSKHDYAIVFKKNSLTRLLFKEAFDL